MSNSYSESMQVQKNPMTINKPKGVQQPKAGQQPKTGKQALKGQFIKPSAVVNSGVALKTTMVPKLSKTPQSSVKPAKEDPNRSRSMKEYIEVIRDLDKDLTREKEYGSILILQLVEEVGEISRAYLAEHGRKPTNKAAEKDETYKQELGDLIVSIMRLAIDKNINLDHRVLYTLKKIKRRRLKPKE